MALRSRPPLMRLTEAAAARVRELMENSGEAGGGLRLGVRKGGCAGMSYTMDYAARPEPGDERVEDKGATVFLAPEAVLFLIGTEMDFTTTKLSSGFVFNNPNQVSACGCGESVSLKPAEREPETLGA